MNSTSETVAAPTLENAAAEKPSHTRYWVVVFAVTLAVVQYIDRICIAKSSVSIQNDLSLSKDDFGWVLGAFALAYALFEIPSGWIGDRYGPRKALIRVVLWWSFFTVATGWTGGFISILVVRFLFGAGEAGCFPNLTRAFVNWLQPSERVRAQSILWFSARLGGAFTPLLVYAVLSMFKAAHFAQPWRQSFFVFGGLGIVWVVLFTWWFRDDPQKHPGVNAAERALLAPNAAYSGTHGGIPWKLFIRSKSAWLLWAQYFFVTYVWYFYITWLSDYLTSHYKDAYGERYLSYIAGMPLFFGAFGCLFSGFITKSLARRWGLKNTRRALASMGLFGTTVCVAFLAMSDLDKISPLTLGLTFGAASMFSDFTMPCGWGACMDVGGRYAGSFSGSMNMMGNFAGSLSPIVCGKLTPHWNIIFWSMTASAFLGALCWLFIDPVTPLEGATREHPNEPPEPEDEPAGMIEEL